MRLLRAFVFATGLLGNAGMAMATDPCDRFTTCRPLTQGEKQLARSFFGDGLRLDHIRIVRGPQKGLRSAFGGDSAYAQVPEPGIIASYGSFHSRDYSRDAEVLPAFMHELVHERQLQKRLYLKIARGALAKFFKSERAYQYSLPFSRSFGHYNSEQQGQIVEDYFRLQQKFRKGRAAFAFNIDVEVDCANMAAISQILAPYFNVNRRPPRLCR